MRLYDVLTRQFQESDPEIKKLALHQLEGLSLDFEAEDVLTFLHSVAQHEKGALAYQARRTLRRLMPQYYAVRYRLRQPPSSAKAGTWTEYNIDRAEIDKLKRLGQAQTQDFTSIQIEQFLKSGLHLLFAPVTKLLDRFPSLPDPVLPDAIQCLANLGTTEAVEALAQVAGRSPHLARLAAGGLAEIKTELAFGALAGLLASIKDPELAGDLIAELRHFPTAEARDLLLKVIDQAPPMRAGAACALASFGKLGAVGHLVRLLKDPDLRVVLWALDSLGRIGDRAALGDLERCFADRSDSWIQRLAVTAAGNTRDRRAMDFLKHAVTSTDGRIRAAAASRAAAIKALIKIHATEQELFDLVFKLINDSNPEVATNAVLAVAPMDTGPVFHRIKGLLEKRDVQTRLYGVWCLSYVQSPLSLALLKQAIYYDDDERVVLSAVKALGKYDCTDSAWLLLSIMRHQKWIVRLNAARILGECRDRELARKLFPRLQQALPAESDPRVKACIYRALSRLGDPSQYLVISKGLKDSAEEVVLEAIEGLDVLGNIDSIALLEPFLADPRPIVRSHAALALWNQGEIRVARRLAEGLDSGDDQQLLGCLKSLAEILASLRRLEHSAKYVLLFSELKANLKTPDFAAFESKVKDIRTLSGASVAHAEAFEFQTVVDRSAGPDSSHPGQPALAVGKLDEPPPAIGAGPASQPGAPARGEGRAAPPADAGAEVPAGPSGSGQKLTRAISVSERDEVMIEPRSDEHRLAFISNPGLAEEPAGEAEPPAQPLEIELEEMLGRIRNGEGRGVMARLLELNREHGGAVTHLLTAQILTEASRTDTPERESVAKRALEELEKSLKCDPELVEPSLRLAELHRDRDRRREHVFHHYLTAVQTALRLIHAEMDRARQLLSANQFDEVAPVVAGLMRQLPSISQANAIHGEVLHRRGENEQAFSHLHGSHMADPANHALTYLLARAASQCGKQAYARRLLDGLARDPEVASELADKARQLLKKL
ncbi:MAG: HEAT repeat domain-containing protein [Candidatus Riflebacteria bacterium]|nr:HEAT repeat domain-containing protein [Candidatus Riflebacteria bacterium]